MKKISALLFVAVTIAASVQAQVGEVRNAVSSTTELVQKTGDMRSSAAFKSDCAAGLALDSCAKPVTPPGCPPGQKWVTTGSNIAHCVGVDPVCVSPSTLEHDFLGNPTCVAPKITYQTESKSRACASPMTGRIRQIRTNTYTNGVLTSYGAWEYVSDTCSMPEPAPTCANGATDYPTCTPPYTPPVTTPPPAGGGGTTPPPPAICLNGASNYPTCTFPPGDTPPACNAMDAVVSTSPCGPGMEGTIENHQTVSCPGSVVGSYQTGTCTPAVCANGATNWPTCSVAPEVTCPAETSVLAGTRPQDDYTMTCQYRITTWEKQGNACIPTSQVVDGMWVSPGQPCDP